MEILYLVLAGLQVSIGISIGIIILLSETGVIRNP